MNLKMPRKSVYKVFRPVGRVVQSNGELLCMSDGIYFLIKFASGHFPHSSICGNPHVRFVLKVNFVLVSTLYGVPHCEYAYEDIYYPRQIVCKGSTVLAEVPVKKEA